MNEQELRIKKLEEQVGELTKKLSSLGNSVTLPLEVDRAFVARGFSKFGSLTGILKSAGTLVTAIVPLAGTKTYYVSDTSEGLVNRRLTFSNGILTSES